MCNKNLSLVNNTISVKHIHTTHESFLWSSSLKCIKMWILKLDRVFSSLKSLGRPLHAASHLNEDWPISILEGVTFKNVESLNFFIIFYWIPVNGHLYLLHVNLTCTYMGSVPVVSLLFVKLMEYNIAFFIQKRFSKTF